MSENIIKINRFAGVYPAIAYTDFSAVFISAQIKNADEYATLLKHECAHIWLQHQPRLILLKKEIGKVDHKRWNQAADLEIALHIYDDSDENTINRPTSLLKKGITKSDAKKYPNCVFAEDFYRELLNTPLEKESQDGEANDQSQDSEKGDVKDFKDGISDEEKQQLIERAKEGIKNKITEEKQSRDAQIFKEELKRIRPRPSLATEIDRHLGRPALARVQSWKRPNRRSEGDFFKKGNVSKQKAPKVLIYVDRSGSFSPEKTKSANEKLNAILAKYRAKFNKDVIFFHDNLFFEEPNSSGGTNYLAVADDIAKMSPTLAIVLTDDDPCDPKSAEILRTCPTNILVIPIGCDKTEAARIFKAKEFNL